MANLNENYLKLKAGYLFPEIARRVAHFTSENKEAAARLIRCGIGDVTETSIARYAADQDITFRDALANASALGVGPKIQAAIAQLDATRCRSSLTISPSVTPKGRR